jgi:hypothetical protein
MGINFPQRVKIRTFCFKFAQPMHGHQYHRKLPHFQPAEATFFVTFRLEGSIPMETIRHLRENYDLMRRGILAQKDLTEKEQRELMYVEQKKILPQRMII